jgi:integrase
MSSTVVDPWFVVDPREVPKMAQHGQVLKLGARRRDGKAVWAYRYRLNGSRSKRPQVGGFATRAAAERALRRELERLRPGRQMTLAELVERYLRVHQAAPATMEKLRWLLGKATAAFGEVRLVDLRADEICAWRSTLPEGHRFEATQALRQVLNAAVAWQLLDVNPAKRGVSNPLRRFPEKRPFESWDELHAVATQLGPATGPLVVFGAATGLRPAELVALERRDVDRAGGVVYVRRQLVRGQIKHTKTQRSVRAVPLQALALEALGQLPNQTGRCSFRQLAAAMSTCTTSARASGAPRRSRPGSSRSAAPTTSGIPMRRLRCAPASRSSTCPASWAPAWR